MLGGKCIASSFYFIPSVLVILTIEEQLLVIQSWFHFWMRIEKSSAEIVEAQPNDNIYVYFKSQFQWIFIVKNNCSYITYEAAYNIITCLCNFTSLYDSLSVPSECLAFPSDIKRETWPEGCNTWVRQTSLNKRLMIISPSPVECFHVKAPHCLFRSRANCGSVH